MENVLITGITGSLGRALCKEFMDINNKNKLSPKYNIFGIYNSEQKYSHFKRNIRFKNIKCHKINIGDINTLYKKIDNIIKINCIDYVIHSAAMKHVDLCENNIIEAINTNIIATDIIVDCALVNKIKNLVGITTDKSIKPCNVYGYSKLLMQKIILNKGYSVYQGANFFGSDGSVLDIWMRQKQKNESLTVTNLKHKRWFNSLSYVSKLIIKNIDIKNDILLPEYVYLITLEDLLISFIEKYNYKNYKVIGSDDNEKEIELIDDTIKTRKKMSIKDIKILLNEWDNTP